MQRELSRRSFAEGVIERVVQSAERIVTPEKIIPPYYCENLAYHEMTAERLYEDIITLLGRGYQPVSLETQIGHLNGDLVIPSDLQTFMVTADDARLSQYEAIIQATAKVEKEKGWFVPVILFVMTQFMNYPLPVEEIPDNTPLYNDWVNNFMTKRQIIELIKRGFRAENHTVNHAKLPLLTEGARNAEVEDGERKIEALWRLARVKRKYKAFAYPYGLYQGQTDYLRWLKYDIAFTTQQRYVHTPESRLTIGRISKT